MNDKFSGYLDFAKQVALKAGEMMLWYFYADKSDSFVKYKDDRTIVTDADKEINKYVIAEVKRHFPDHAVDGEEEQSGKSEMVWVCDPIDGTAMYARRIPVAVFSLALVVKGEPVIGVIYDAFTKNLYSATKGGGAYRNGARIRVNQAELDDERSLAHFDMWPGASYDLYDVIKELNKRTYAVSIGSIAKACTYVATGDFNLAIFPGTKHKNCDIAAAKVIVEEAGGKVTDLFGHEQRYDRDLKGAIISNGVVHEEVVKIVASLI